MTDNPFLTYKIKHGKVHEDRLDINNIAKIAELDLITPTANKRRTKNKY